MSSNEKIVLNQDTQLLKLIAVITMVIDHIGAILFPSVLILRVIGRLSFPLFAFSTFIGYFKTKNLKKYLLRLLILAVISQPIYMIAFDRFYLSLNILFTLIFELIIIYLLDKKKWWYLPIPVVLMFLLNVNYCEQLLILIPIFYYTRNKDFLFALSMITFYFNYAVSYSSGTFPITIYAFGIFALPFMLIKTKSNIKINKWFYYIFYPVHLLILLAIKYII